MNKFTALLMFSLGASFMLQASQAQSCAVGYYNIPPPEECTYVIDENGEEEEECAGVGSAAFGAELDSANPTLTELDFPLNDLDFAGDCECKVIVYSGLGLTGCYVKSDVSSDQVAVIGGIWTRAADPKSFEVACNFAPFQ